LHIVTSKGKGETTGDSFPEEGTKVNISLGTDDGFCYFLSWIPSRGSEVCLQLVSDVESMLPPNNWDLFEKIEGEADKTWRVKEDEMYFWPLEEYWRNNYMRVIDPRFEDVNDTFNEFPLNGFVSRPPWIYPTKSADISRNIIAYEESIRVLGTESIARNHFRIVDAELAKRCAKHDE
jgi:hypothetical protein